MITSQDSKRVTQEQTCMLAHLISTILSLRGLERTVNGPAAGKNASLDVAPDAHLCCTIFSTGLCCTAWLTQLQRETRQVHSFEHVLRYLRNHILEEHVMHSTGVLCILLTHTAAWKRGGHRHSKGETQQLPIP